MTTKQAHRELSRFALGLGLSISESQQCQIDSFAAELAAANARVNLVSRSDPATILLRHVADGAAAAAVLIKEIRKPEPRILDLGAGGGCIGMTIKIVWPEARVTLMESSQRKYRFLNAMATHSGLPGLSITSHRAGEGKPPAGLLNFDAVLERALAPLAKSLQLALPLTAPTGLFLAFQSEVPDPEEARLKRALARHAARLVKSIPYRLPAEKKDRHLVLFMRQGS